MSNVKRFLAEKGGETREGLFAVENFYYETDEDK